MRLKYNSIKVENQIRAMKIIIGVLAILSSFLICGLAFAFSSAWFTDETTQQNDLQMGNIEMNLGDETTQERTLEVNPLVIDGQKIFSKNITIYNAGNQKMFVRVRMKFDGTKSEELNAKLIASTDNSTFKWEQIGPFYYLTNKDGAPLEIAPQTSKEFLNTTELTYPVGASDLHLNFSAKAIQSNPMTEPHSTARELSKIMKDGVEDLYKLTINITKPNVATKTTNVWVNSDYTIRDLHIEGYDVLINESNMKDINEYVVSKIDENTIIEIIYKKQQKIKLDSSSIQFVKGDANTNATITIEENPKTNKFKLVSSLSNPKYQDSSTSVENAVDEFYYFEDEKIPNNKYYLSGIDYGGEVWQNGSWVQRGATEYWYDIPVAQVTLNATYKKPNNFTGNKNNGAKADGDVVLGHCVSIIGDHGFFNCSSLISITIPDSVTRIGQYVFAECISLTSITIPPSMINIGGNAFWYCFKLTTSIIIPASVTVMGNDAFSGCDELKSIFCEAWQPTAEWAYHWMGDCKAKIYWKGQWHYENGVPTPGA